MQVQRMKWLDNFHPSLRIERQKDQSGPLVPRILGPEGNLSAHSKAQTKELELRSRAPVFVRGLERIRHVPLFGEAEFGPYKTRQCQAKRRDSFRLAA